MEFWVQKTAEQARRACRFDPSVLPDEVVANVLEARLEWITLPGMNVENIERFLKVNKNFAQTLQSIAETEETRRTRRGLSSRCNLCGEKFAYKDLLTRHNWNVHQREDPGATEMKKEVKEEVVFTVDDESDEDTERVLERPSKKVRLAGSSPEGWAPIEGDVFVCLFIC